MYTAYGKNTLTKIDNCFIVFFLSSRTLKTHFYAFLSKTLASNTASRTPEVNSGLFYAAQGATQLPLDNRPSYEKTSYEDFFTSI